MSYGLCSRMNVPVIYKLIVEMELPSNFSSYFKEAIEFLEDYSWLFDFAVTDLLVNNVFSKMPTNWLEHFEKMTFLDVSKLQASISMVEWPESLVQFSEKCLSLSLATLIRPVLDRCSNETLDKEMCRGLSPKKQHEVKRFASTIDSVCKKTGTSGIIDIGCGLGYVDRLLAVQNYQVLGIEMDVQIVQKATFQFEKLLPKLTKNVNFTPWNVCGNSASEFSQIVEKYARSDNEKNLCMVGLHTCGDLASSSIKLFLATPSIHSLVLVPCCYHKMSLLNFHNINNSVQTDFKNFPLSNTLSKLLYRPEHREIFSRPFLRLASQESQNRWKSWSTKEHETNAFYVLSRAVLQLYTFQKGLQLRKRYRRAVKKNMITSFKSFLENITERFDFIHSSTGEVIIEGSKSHENIFINLLSLWEMYKNKLLLAETVIVLQMQIQSVAESLVIIDYLSYLRENHIQNLKAIKIFDEKISPRCLALLASKQKM